MPILGDFPSGSGTGGTGVALANVSNIKTLAASGKAYLKWTDPSDFIAAGMTLAEWAGTLLVRKAGSAPASRRDGVIVLDSKERNAYQNEYFCDSGLSDGVVYFYKLFPYSKGGVYTSGPEGEVQVTPEAVKLGDVSGLTLDAAGNGKLAIRWTDPDAAIVSDGVTLAAWASTAVVVKAGGYAETPNDPDAAFTYTNTTRNAYAANALIATGLTNGETYYVSLFPTSADGAANDSVANRGTGAPDRLRIPAVPSQSGTLTYARKDQPPVWDNYDAATLSVSGDTTGYNAGDYTTRFTPDDDHCWADGSTDPVDVVWTIGRYPVARPDYKMDATTTCSFEIKGSLEVFQEIRFDGYAFEVGDDISVGPLIPDDGTPNTEQHYTIGGDRSTYIAGDYILTCTLRPNFKWEDDGTDVINVPWHVNKIQHAIELGESSVVLSDSCLNEGVACRKIKSREISVTSSDSNIVTAEYTPSQIVGIVDVVTICNVNKKSGTATITVKAKENDYYASSEATIAVTADFLSPVLNDNSWAKISEISALGKGSNYWNVGDRKSITINGNVGQQAINATYWVYILGFNHNSTHEGNGIHFGGFKTAQTGGTDICLIDNYYDSYQSYNGTKYFQINHRNSGQHSSNYGGWAACDMRYDILGSTNQAPSGYGSDKTTSDTGNDPTATCATSPVANTLMAAPPADLRAVMKPMTKYTDNKGNSSNVAANVTKTIDYLPLLAEFEVLGTRSYANQYEQNYQAQYDYYKGGNSKVKYRHSSTGSTADWWERSPSCNGADYFCRVGTGGNASDGFASRSNGLAPAFKV